jgi:hypothetical protein
MPIPIPSIREHLRWRGSWIVFLLALREVLKPLLYWHVWHIFESDLTRELPRPYSTAKFDVVICTARDELAGITPRILSMGELSAAEVERRFCRGDAMALAYSSGEPVGYMWMGFSSGIELGFDTCWIIRNGEALRYGSFVIPSFRGHAVHSVVNSALNSYALERGVTRTLGSVSALNPQSLSLAKHYHRAIAMTVVLVRFRLRSFTVRTSFRAPLSSRFLWAGRPEPAASPRESALG